MDKPKGLTSHDVVSFLRKRFSIGKVGHAGTLDPMATGVLVLLLGRATRLSGKLSCDDKEYEASMRLGITTDSHDSEGKVVCAKETGSLSEDEIKKAFCSFLGVIEQVPPMVSAIKHKGKKLYQLARRGVEIERAPRKITIYDLRIKSISMPDVSFAVSCSKGTYIRKLASDIGEKLGCGAHLTSLRRTRSGRFTIGEAVTFEELKRFDSGMLEKHIYKNGIR